MNVNVNTNFAVSVTETLHKYQMSLKNARICMQGQDQGLNCQGQGLDFQGQGLQNDP